MEDYDNLINSNDGTHCILFKNHHALELEEITQIFSQFGTIHNVRFNQNKTSHCFIRYRQRNDAIRAVEGLRNHPKISLLKPINRNQRNRDNSARSQNGDHGQESDGPRFTRHFRQQNNENVNESGFHRNRSFGNNHHNGNDINNDLPWGSDRVQQDNVQQGPKSPNQNQSHVPKKSPNASPKSNDLPLGPKSPNSCERSSDGLPDLVDRNEKAQIEDEENEIPELVTANGKTLTANIPMKKIIPAQEVIVANIHPKFGAAYILHLLDGFEPLAISNIKIEPKSGKRYCHVYFKTGEESREVEKLFDKKLLMDQQLIVLRRNQLIENAYFK